MIQKLRINKQSFRNSTSTSQRLNERQMSFEQQNLGNSEITELAISSLKQSVEMIKGQVIESRVREQAIREGGREQAFREANRDTKETASLKSSLDGIVRLGEKAFNFRLIRTIGNRPGNILKFRKLRKILKSHQKSGMTTRIINKSNTQTSSKKSIYQTISFLLQQKKTNNTKYLLPKETTSK